MRFTILGSGSAGNSLLIEAQCPKDAASFSRVLIDCGFGLRAVESKLLARGIEPALLNGIVVTHEHGDHVGGVFRLARKYKIPVYLTRGTLRACAKLAPDDVLTVLIDSHQAFTVGALTVQPFAVPHDANEPICCVVSTNSASLALLTDLGRSTPAVMRAIEGVNVLVLECNHDTLMLHEGPYMPSLKRRVGGDWGHLSNDQAARILDAHDRTYLRVVVAAHLSRTNNTPESAAATLRAILADSPIQLFIADQDNGIEWLSACADAT